MILLAITADTADIAVLTKCTQHVHINIISAESSDEALSIFMQSTPDCVLVDIEIEGINGIELLNTIRKAETSFNHKIRTPIIAASTHCFEDMQVEMLSHGFDDYCSKPINSEKLQGIVSRWRKQKELPPARQPVQISLSNGDKKESTIVDLQLSLLRSHHDKKLAADLLILLMDMLKTEKDNINRCITNKAWEKLYPLNHKLYGGSSYCGTPNLQQANQQLERLLQHCCPDENEHSPDTLDNKNIIAAATQLQEAIDELLVWDQEHDIHAVFNG